jgi:hypothetical protein
MKIEKYNIGQLKIWNGFVENSKQETFLLNRNYMDYHSDRFTDNSLMFYDNNDLIAVLPANIKDGNLYSHQGLSYGGLIYGREARTIDVLRCFEALKIYMKDNNIKSLIYKKIPYIYNIYPADEDLYALFRNDAKLIRRDIGYAIDIDRKIKLSRNKTRYLKKTESLFSIRETQDFQSFYLIMEDALTIHNATPVHSAEEIKLLTNRFPDNIKLYGVFDANNIMVAGSWIFINKNVIHIQNMLATMSAKKFNAIDFVYNFILSNLSKDKKYLSFGISTEKDGLYLNEGLTQQKESFGARGICYDFYNLSI